jgi:hypothetical protein
MKHPSQDQTPEYFKANKPRHATNTSRAVSMIFRNYNTNPEIDARRRW